jgi:cytochrome c-type biogenesis protein
MTDLTTVALVSSFAAGIVSFLSPCVLPLVPGYVSYVAGHSLRDGTAEAAGGGRFAAVRLSMFFVFGFSTVFVILGASATVLGRLFLSYRTAANIGAGIVVIIFGLLMIGLVDLAWLQRDARFHLRIPGGRPIAAYVLGLAFAFGWTPCIGPVLGAILTASAVSATVVQGMVLLSVYSLGLGVPFLAAAFFTDRLLGRLRKLSRVGRTLQIGAGCVVVGIGFAIMTQELSVVTYWLLDAFPGFAQLG